MNGETIATATPNESEPGVTATPDVRSPLERAAKIPFSQPLDSFIREGNGKLSSSRLLLMLWGGGVFLIWAIASLRSEALQAIPDSVITVVGVLVGAKTVQRFGE